MTIKNLTASQKEELTHLFNFVFSKENHNQNDWFCGTSGCVAGEFAIQKYPEIWEQAYSQATSNAFGRTYTHSLDTISTKFVELLKPVLRKTDPDAFKALKLDSWKGLFGHHFGLTVNEANFITSPDANEDLHRYMLSKICADKRLPAISDDVLLDNEGDVYEDTDLMYTSELCINCYADYDYRRLNDYFADYNGNNIIISM